MNTGSSNRLPYDNCAYEKKIYESTSPLAYQMYEGAYENCNKCTHNDKFWRPFDKEIVDIESELKNLSRPASQCDQYKYSPSCKKSGICTSTYDPSVPVVFAPEVCPIVFSNIPRQTGPGYKLPAGNLCLAKKTA